MTVHFLTLLRHGESEGNSAGVLQGQSDYPLTQGGIEQAKSLAGIWKSQASKFDLIISSPLKRAAQTAQIISSYLNIPIEFEPAWMERNYGRLQGTQMIEFDRLDQHVDFIDPYHHIGENGESLMDLYLRVSMALLNVVRHPDGKYLVVSHGGILNQALRVAMNIPPQHQNNIPAFQFGNLGYAQLQHNYVDRQWAILSLDNHYPLDPIQREN